MRGAGGDAEFVGEPVHLCLELHDAVVVAGIESLDEIAHLLHLHPQIRTQHDQVVESIAQHPAIRGDHGVAVRLVEFGEHPCQIAAGSLICISCQFVIAVIEEPE